MLGADHHFIIPNFYFLIIYCHEWVSRKARKEAKTRCFSANKALRHKVTRRLFYISEMKTPPFGGLRGLTNSRIFYRGEIEIM
jgi:hypothetical protein